MYISEYMTKDPLKINPDLTISQAREILDSKHFRHLPVVDDNGRLLGIITDRDIRSAYPSSLAPDEERKRTLEQTTITPVGSIMSRVLSTLSPDATLDDALLFFRKHIVGAIPITDKENKLVGIFSIRDMIKAYSNIFGLGEKGSQLIAVEDDLDKKNIMSLIVRVLESNNISFTRIMRTGSRIYIRAQSYNIKSIKAALESEGLNLIERKVDV
jgi:acetoin utilization protein AcuB